MNIHKNRIIIAGGRDFKDYLLLTQKIHSLIINLKPSETMIIIGGAKGADTLGKRFAEQNNLHSVTYDAKWDDIEAEGAVVRIQSNGKPYNALAGHWRNEAMAKDATHLIAFWNGKSTGTKDMIERAKKHNLKIRIVYY